MTEAFAEVACSCPPGEAHGPPGCSLGRLAGGGFQRGSVAGRAQALPEPPSYSAVRAKLRVLEEKGHVRHEEEALRYVYLPTVAR